MKKIVLTSAAALLVVGMAANAGNVYVLGGASYGKVIASKALLNKNPMKQTDHQGYTVGAGYNFNKKLAVQATYTTEPNMSSTHGEAITYIKNAYNAALEIKGTLPISKSFSVYGLGGADYSSYQSTGAFHVAGLEHGITPVAGLGIGYKVSKQISLDLTSQYVFGKDKKDIPAYSNTAVEAQFNF